MIFSETRDVYARELKECVAFKIDIYVSRKQEKVF